jgi:hypothetical protein
MEGRRGARGFGRQVMLTWQNCSFGRSTLGCGLLWVGAAVASGRTTRRARARAYRVLEEDGEELDGLHGGMDERVVRRLGLTATSPFQTPET